MAKLKTGKPVSIYFKYKNNLIFGQIQAHSLGSSVATSLVLKLKLNLKDPE